MPVSTPTPGKPSRPPAPTGTCPEHLLVFLPLRLRVGLGVWVRVWMHGGSPRSFESMGCWSQGNRIPRIQPKNHPPPSPKELLSLLLLTQTLLWDTDHHAKLKGGQSQMSRGQGPKRTFLSYCPTCPLSSICSWLLLCSSTSSDTFASASSPRAALGRKGEKTERFALHHLSHAHTWPWIRHPGPDSVLRHSTLCFSQLLPGAISGLAPIPR